MRLQDLLDENRWRGYPHALKLAHQLPPHFRGRLVTGMDAQLLLFLDYQQPMIHFALNILFGPFPVFAHPVAGIGKEKEVQIDLAISVAELLAGNSLAVDRAVISAGRLPLFILEYGEK